ncbi:outer membrane beta-barrel protein [Bradyrhizobium sp. Arg237L]|uniref:outer membrane beta-barrel protein n=1 Tax=Bradyrhizobium sp. Arg237L TaxID=3003352 RepID=UPI00249E80D3|nr:outer membrane beta-barrel protein [Bradyrhizobium sp. Arg237L]MDI4234930.1 outer membrane beta-barrel protein [Bradyrhizobium sp. Arg237L]
MLPWPNEEVAPPWNAQQIFEPSPLPKLTDPDTREDIPPEDTPVKGRLQPGYEPVGIRSGSWMFNPSLITGGFFDSNVFASNTDIRSDVAAVVEPSLRAHSLWERHGLDLKLDAQETVYKQNSSLNQTNASLKGNGWIDIAHDMALLGSFQIAHLNEGVGSLSSPANAIAPTPYNLYSGDVTLRKEFNRLTTSVGFRTDSYDFGSTVSQDGRTINQDARDGQIYSLHSRIDYAFSDTLGWFGSAEGNVRELRGQPLQPLSSQGYRALTGVTLGLTRLLTGEIGFGYVQQQFVDPTVGTIAGPTYRARLTWSPTRMVDVHFNAEQIVTETSDTSATGVLANAVQLGLDYELRRNVIVSFYGGYESDRFFGQPRKDQVTTSDARVKYLLNRFAAIAVYYRFTSRESNIPTFSYDKHLVGLNVTTQF